MTPRQRKSITISFHHRIKEDVYRAENLLLRMGVSMIMVTRSVRGYKAGGLCLGKGLLAR